MIALKEATLKKLEFDYDLSKFIAVVNSGFSNIKGPVKQEVLDLIASKIALEVDPNNLDVEMRYENIYAENLLVFIRDFDSSHSQARELFYRITTKIFVAQVTKEYSYFSSQGLGQRLQFLKEYLIVAHTYQAFQLVFLDLSILMIHQILENKNFSVDFVTMCQIMKSLAALSYSDRFNSYMAHKETQIEKWQNILVRSDEIFSNSTNEYMENMEIIKEDDSDIEIESFTGLAIDYLWAMCVFDFYSKTSLQKAISTLILNNEEIHGQEMISMLTQIHYWLKLEHGDEIKLDSNIVKKLENFKYKWNKQQNLGRTSGLKEAIKMTMDSQKQEYIENYSDFPYVLDFSSRLGHNAILVDDENSFLEGSDGLIRSGFNKVMLRQLVPMGWSVKRYDLKSWIKSGNGDVFGLQTL